VDGLHGSFLTIDENGQQLFAATTSGLSIVKLANVPLGIGSIVPSSGAAEGEQASHCAEAAFSLRRK
jgi:hypothetical protein